MEGKKVFSISNINRQWIVDVAQPHAAWFLPVRRHSLGLERIKHPGTSHFPGSLPPSSSREREAHIETFHQPQEEPCGVLRLPRKPARASASVSVPSLPGRVLGTEQAVDAVGDPVRIEHRRVPQPRLVDEVQHRAGACAAAAPATPASTGPSRRAARRSRETRPANAVSR